MKESADGLAPPYPVRTERLDLRPPTPDDAAAVAVYKSQPDTVRFVPHGPLSTAELVQRYAEAPTALVDAGGFLPLLVFLRETGELLGDVVLMWRSREHMLGEVGYIFDPAHAGRGYATEAAAAVLALGFDDLGLHRMEGHLDARNGASAAVLRRLGMRQEAHLRENEWFKGEWTDLLIYAILADEWRSAQARH